MKSEIQKEMEENMKKMEELIEKQIFSIKDANYFLKRYYNVLRKLIDLEESRDKWKAKALEKMRV